MAKGNSIIVSAEAKGRHLEFTINGALLPGTLVTQVRGVAADGSGRMTYEAWNEGGAGQQDEVVVLVEDSLQGQTMTTAYVSGARAFGYAPLPSEDMNVLVAIPGTGTSAAGGVTVAERLEAQQATGYLMKSFGSPEGQVLFKAQEAISDISGTGVVLAWVKRL